MPALASMVTGLMPMLRSCLSRFLPFLNWRILFVSTLACRLIFSRNSMSFHFFDEEKSVSQRIRSFALASVL